MKPLRKATKKFIEKVINMKKLYLVVCLADYVVMECNFSGKYTKGMIGEDVPLVWQYDDFNGKDNCYVLRPITYTTTGTIVCWTPYQYQANQIAKALSEVDK